MSGVLKYTLVVQHPDTLTPVALLVGKPVPEWAQDLVHEDDYEAEPDGDGDEDEDESEAGDSAKLPTLPELKAEIAKRNDGREEADLIKPASAKKADLIAALEADDHKS